MQHQILQGATGVTVLASRTISRRLRPAFLVHLTDHVFNAFRRIIQFCVKLLVHVDQLSNLIYT